MSTRDATLKAFGVDPGKPYGTWVRLPRARKWHRLHNARMTLCGKLIDGLHHSRATWVPEPAIACPKCYKWP